MKKKKVLLSGLSLCFMVCLLVACKNKAIAVKDKSSTQIPATTQQETQIPVETTTPIETTTPVETEQGIVIQLEEGYLLSQEEIRYKIINHTKECVFILMIPHLERMTEDGWKSISSTAGFCGVADSLEEEIEGELCLEWYPELKEGHYRVSYEILDQDQKESYFISEEFYLYESIAEGVSIDIKTKKIDPMTKKIILELTNDSDQTYLFGHEQYLEQKVSEGWKEVVMLDGVGWNDIGILLKPNSTVEEIFYLKDFYGSLPIGEYKLRKVLYPQSENEESLNDEVILDIRFTIKSS